MKLSEELQWRGFYAENTLDDITDLDKAPRNFYWGTDPSADSLHIGHLAALMMCACFVRHGYTPYYLPECMPQTSKIRRSSLLPLSGIFTVNSGWASSCSRVKRPSRT